MIRTHDAGTLTAADAGQTVTLAGWVARRRDHGGVAFLDLREASGSPRSWSVTRAWRTACAASTASRSPARSSCGPRATPTRTCRPARSRSSPTRVEVLSAAAPLPFPIDDHVDVGEEARLEHRYLDLRRSGPNAALRLRSKVNKAARDVLDRHDFVEVETPTLTRSTPEGARDFLVPARLQPGSWYALPQSPQLFKQLLMVAGMERYFQIARCYRDEDFRADRQPEFTQLDVEMSFVDQDDVLAVSEEVLVALWTLIGVDLPTPFPRMTYAEAMARFGTDKPDLRMGLELVDCTDVLHGHARSACSRPPYVGAVVMPGGAASPASSSTPGRSGPSSAGPGASPTCCSLRTASSAARSPRTSPRRSGPAWPRTSARSRATAPSSRPARSRRSRALLGAARLEIGRRGGLIDEDAWSFALGRRRAAVRARRRGHGRRRRRGRQRRLDRRAPRLHLAAGRWTPSTQDPGSALA